LKLSNGLVQPSTLAVNNQVCQLVVSLHTMILPWFKREIINILFITFSIYFLDIYGKKFPAAAAEYVW
jgi:ABC-type protease/lipase transport system fused ATPase/permease subunit